MSSYLKLSLLAEFESSFSCTFSDDGSAGACVMAKILFSSFLKEIKGEIIQFSDKRTPLVFCVILGRQSSTSLSRGAIPLTLTLMLNEELLGIRSLGLKLVLPVRILPSAYIPLIVCVSFGRNGDRLPANSLLDTGNGQLRVRWA